MQVTPRSSEGNTAVCLVAHELPTHCNETDLIETVRAGVLRKALSERFDSGQVTPPGSTTPLPLAGAGLTTYFPNGTISGVVTYSLGGQVSVGVTLADTTRSMQMAACRPSSNRPARQGYCCILPVTLRLMAIPSRSLRLIPDRLSTGFPREDASLTGIPLVERCPDQLRAAQT